MLKKKTAAEFFERTLNDCCQLVRTMQLSDFLPQSRSILDVFQNYRQAYGLNETAFFLTSLTAIGHFGNNSATYCQTSNICTKSNLFLVIVGPSASKKSKYVQKIYDSATVAEKFLIQIKNLEEQMALKKFSLRIENDKTITMPLTKEDLRKITFIEQSLTYAEAMQSLTFSNLFLCASEGDFILDQLNFFNQANKDNMEMRGCASALFDGQTITRSTRQGKTFIEGKTLSICVGSTGSKWSSILLHLHENLTSDGFHPRFLFYALEPAATIDGLIGDRLQTFTTDAAEFIQPYLNCLNSNESCADESPRSTTSYEEVVVRRGAELIVRIASNIQYMTICLKIIRLIDQVDFYTIDESFVNQASAIIASNLGPSKPFSMGHNALPTNLQPKLMITKETCEEAVKIFFKIFIPQHFTIMNYRYHNDTIETSSELGLQTRILKVKYRIFHKTALSGNNGMLKNIDKDLLNHLLDRLVQRGILKKGNYLQSERSIKYESYIKYLPCALTEQQQLSVQLKKHDISFEEYQQLFRESEISPPSTRVTSYGKLELEKQNMGFGDTHDVQRQQSSAPQDSGTQNGRNQNTSISHIINALDLSSINAFDSLSNNGLDLSSVDSVNKRQTNNMLPPHNISMNSSAYNNYFYRPVLQHNASSSTNAMSNMRNQVNSSTTLPNNMRQSVDGQTEQHHENVSSHDDSTITDNEDYMPIDYSKASSNHQQQISVSVENQSIALDHLYSIITTTDIAAQSTTSNTKEGQDKPFNSRSQIITSKENFDKEFSSRMSSQFHQQRLETDNEFDFDQNDSDVESYSFFKPSMVNTSTPRESIDKDHSTLNVHVPQQQSNELELLSNQNSLSSNLIREIESLQSPNSNREKISNEQFLNFSSMSSASLSSTSQTITFDPVAALANPSSIPKRILDKCKQFLLSNSPVITRTCWNRRFGGDANLCHQATQLLLTADLLMEGQFIACSTKSSTNWIKKLPIDPTNTTTTLSFQQNKLNIFGITWNQYASSFRQVEVGNSYSSGLISLAAAIILRSKPYLDIGFILDETIILEKKEKKTLVAHRQDQTEPANLSLTSVQDIHLASFSEQENSNSIHGDSIASIVTQSLPINDTSSILIQSTLFSSAPIEIPFNNPISNAPSTPKRTRRELSPMRTRSKSRRLDK
ncbi:unnamed protein product [Rotaria socialis]